MPARESSQTAGNLDLDIRPCTQRAPTWLWPNSHFITTLTARSTPILASFSLRILRIKIGLQILSCTCTIYIKYKVERPLRLFFSLRRKESPVMQARVVLDFNLDRGAYHSDFMDLYLIHLSPLTILPCRRGLGPPRTIMGYSEIFLILYHGDECLF